MHDTTINQDEMKTTINPQYLYTMIGSHVIYSHLLIEYNTIP